MTDEASDVREILAKEKAELTRAHSRIDKAMAYLELILGDHPQNKSPNENSIIEMCLQYLREE